MEKAPWNKTPALTKSMNIWSTNIWIVGTSNQLFTRGSETETKFSKKIWSIYWENSVLCDWSILYSPILFALTLVLDIAVLYRKDAFSILVLSTKKGYSSFSNKVLVFQKLCFKVKVLKTFTISSDCHIKTYWSLKRRDILKIPSTVFSEEPTLFLLALKWNL